MRARNIKPGFFKNETLIECSVWARLLAPGLWMIADREGRLEDRPKRIKIEIFPCDNVDVDQLLAELAYHQHIKRYEIGGKRFIQICKFNEHQRPHNNETESDIPNENGDYSKPKEKILSPKVESASYKPESASSLTTDSLNPDSLNPEKEELRVQGSEKQYSMEFDVFWLAYPDDRRKEKPKAYTEWKKAIKISPAFEITKSAIVYERCDEARRGYAPYPAKWLKNHRWKENHTVGAPDAKPNPIPTRPVGETKTDRLIAAAKRGHASPVFGFETERTGPAGTNTDAYAMLPSPEIVREGAGADRGGDSNVPDGFGGLSH